MKRKLLLLFAALCLLLGGCSSGTETVSAPELLEPAGVELDFAAAQVMDLYTVTPYSASVVPYVEEMSFAVNGEIESVHVSLGSSVKKGDVLIVLDEEELLEKEAELAEEAEYLRQVYENASEIARIDIRIAQLRLEQMQKDGADGAQIAAAQTDIDMMELKLSQQEEQQAIELASLEEDLASVRQDIGHNVLYAPFDGVVVAMEDLREERYVQAYETIIQIADESRLHISSDFVTENAAKNAHEIYALIGDERYAVQYMPVDMEEYLNAVFSGAVLHTDFAFGEDIPSGISCGDYAAVCVVSAYTPDALCIPVNALYSDTAGRYVYRLEGDQRTRVNVHTGASNSLYIEITDGLEEGDQVYVKE